MGCIKAVLGWFGRRLVMKKNAMRAVIFIMLGILMLSVLNKVVTNAGDYRIYQFYNSFYTEEENSLDAVYIGSSITYTFWSASLAWERYGIAVHPFTCPNQPFEVAEYMIKEARKTQPDALYIVPINSINDDEGISDVKMHYVADYMPLSWNKIQMVRALGGYMGIDWTEQMEFLFPLIRFHSRWNELMEKDFSNPPDGLKGASYYRNFLRTSTDISSDYRTTERTGTLSENTRDAMDSLLEYCDAEQVNVLFIAVPNAQIDEYKLAQINTIKRTVLSHGYPVLDMRSSLEEIGLDLTKDYYNERHTNIHGAIKVTDYVAKYLVENYGFEDKRGDPAYSSWDEAYDKYTVEYALVNTLDVEWEREPRDSTLEAPELSKVTVDGTSLTVSWEKVSGADGYRIYRRLKAEDDDEAPETLDWQAVDTVTADELSYEDVDREVGRTYYYTVIAYKEKGGVRYWGDYDFAGVSGKALLNVPQLQMLYWADNGNEVTLTWEQVEGADGYAVFRKLPSKTWIEIADVENDITFTDADMLSNMPYQYTVKAYYLDEEGSRVMSSYDIVGLLYAPEFELPTLEATVENGTICLSWERIEGIQGYTVYRRTQNSDWGQLTTGNLSGEITEFHDITAQAGIGYAYKIEIYIRVGEQERVYEMQTGSEWIRTEKSAYDTTMPEIVYLEQAYDQVYIAWEPTDGASSYRVYRRAQAKDGSWSEWKSIKSSTTATSYLDKPSKSGSYEYRIQSLFKKDGLIYYGEIDEESRYSSIDYSTVAE